MRPTSASPIAALAASACLLMACSAPAPRPSTVTLGPPPPQGQGPYGAPPPGGVASPPGQAVDPTAVDPSATRLLDAFLSALQGQRDEEAAARAVLPFVHKSMLGPSGGLSDDVRRFSFKKAFGAAPLYAVPVVVTRVRPSSTTAIGFGPTGERGRSVDYFVAKRPGQVGMPAPVTVFFPESGAPPSIAYVGSL
ncbi:MAG: hypothetical protein IPK71_27015 [Myxococcales bacterium]|nr:hypothetical protein [Myxococcales bacterium]